MKSIRFSIFILFLTTQNLLAQTVPTKPKLVVVIVVDQMRADYLDRYRSYFGAGGFRKLTDQGRNFKNAHYNFFPTYTAAGHSSISTGATPSVNGIVGNEWFDRLKGKVVYCTTDTNTKTIGATSVSGKMSPYALLSTTLGDELRLSTNFQAKNIAIALKDRAAILSAGHNATGVYWFDEFSGNFVSSSYYCQQLPSWLNSFNDQKLADKYLSERWETALPLTAYQTTSTADNVPFEGKFKGEELPIFPHNIPELRKNYNYGLIRNVPNGLKLTFDLAKAAINGENLGKGNVPDLLTVSLSSTDYIGHQYGPRSIEVADTYVKLDREIAGFIDFLDTKIGKNNYVIVLTADHGAADNPDFLNSQKLPGGFMDGGLIDSLNNYILKKYRISPVMAFSNLQFYFDKKMIKYAQLSYEKIISDAKDYLEEIPYVSFVYSKDEILNGSSQDGSLLFLKNGYYPKRCGDLTLVLNPGYLETSSPRTGTTHGTVYNYDTRVPLLWYGGSIQAGQDNSDVKIIDIAPTLSNMLNIQAPSGCQGKIITTVFK